MPKITLVRTDSGHVLLNAGCGNTFSADWNNIDIRRRRGVMCHDLRKSLSYPSDTFDAVYSSHVLEHFTPEDGARFLREMYRVLKPGAVCRIVVPDFERACREYLRRIEIALKDGEKQAVDRYKWSVMELIDQFVREKTGGLMLETLMAGNFDEEYVRQRNGEEFSIFYSSDPSGSRPSHPSQGFFRERMNHYMAVPSIRKPVWTIARIGSFFRKGGAGPQETGEAHKWAYDRLSLRLLMKETGLEQIEVRSFDQSRIPGWPEYRLDSTEDGRQPRKPDSLYMEGIKQDGN